jgi:4-amino-4-deoxy-L-arabinose transferase-like glycosyltransferase
LAILVILDDCGNETIGVEFEGREFEHSLYFDAGRIGSVRRQQVPYPFWFAFLFACLPLFGWWMTGLFDLDEGFYGAVVAEMNRRGEWITPYYNGEPWYEKPILLYWLAKPFVGLFGVWFGSRIPSVVCTAALYPVIFWFVRRRLGHEIAVVSVFCAGSSLLVLALGRLMMTDAPLNLALTVAFLSFYESLVGDRRLRLLTAGMLGIGVLAKGPICLILFVLIAGITYWKQPEVRSAFRGYWLGGTTILASVIASWYVPCYLANRQEFVQKFLIEQNIGRFTGGDTAHSLGLQGFLFFLPVILIAIFPWGVLEWKWIKKENRESGFEQYLFIWAMTIIVFFSISSAKLVHYVLPALPPIAILVAKRIVIKPWLHWRSPMLPIVFAIFLLMLLDTAQRAWYVKSGQAEAHVLMLKHPEVNATFRLSRQTGVLGTGSTQLQETSLPSLVMLANKPLLQTDDPGRLHGKIVLTRSDRVERLSDREREDWSLLERGVNFSIYRVK